MAQIVDVESVGHLFIKEKNYYTELKSLSGLIRKKKENEQETKEMFDEVMEFVMWLDNNFLDEEVANRDDDATRAGASDTDRYNHACSKSFWYTVSTILLPKRQYQ
jgi:hypothetical protein